MYTQQTATIANNASLSGAINTGGDTPVAIIMPASWTTAVLTFQVSYDNTTFNNLYDLDVEVTAASAAASVAIALPADLFKGFKFFKIRSGTAASAVNQGGARSLIVQCARVLPLENF